MDINDYIEFVRNAVGLREPQPPPPPKPTKEELKRLEELDKQQKKERRAERIREGGADYNSSDDESGSDEEARPSELEGISISFVKEKKPKAKGGAGAGVAAAGGGSVAVGFQNPLHVITNTQTREQDKPGVITNPLAQLAGKK
jgi:hypothetical protein